MRRDVYRTSGPNESALVWVSKSVATPVVAVLIIGKTGEIVDAQIQKAGQVEPRLLSCMTDALKGWTFPPPNDGGMAVLRLVL
jgi:hypothetical protein